MSDLRIFCIGYLLGGGIFAACVNHGWGNIHPEKAGPDGMIAAAMIVGCLAVMIFGGRRP